MLEESRPTLSTGADYQGDKVLSSCASKSLSSFPSNSPLDGDTQAQNQHSRCSSLTAEVHQKPHLQYEADTEFSFKQSEFMECCGDVTLAETSQSNKESCMILLDFCSSQSSNRSPKLDKIHASTTLDAPLNKKFIMEKILEDFCSPPHNGSATNVVRESASPGLCSQSKSIPRYAGAVKRKIKRNIETDLVSVHVSNGGTDTDSFKSTTRVCKKFPHDTITQSSEHPMRRSSEKDILNELFEAKDMVQNDISDSLSYKKVQPKSTSNISNLQTEIENAKILIEESTSFIRYIQRIFQVGVSSSESTFSDSSNSSFSLNGSPVRKKKLFEDIDIWTDNECFSTYLTQNACLEQNKSVMESHTSDGEVQAHKNGALNNSEVQTTCFGTLTTPKELVTITNRAKNESHGFSQTSEEVIKHIDFEKHSEKSLKEGLFDRQKPSTLIRSIEEYKQDIQEMLKDIDFFDDGLDEEKEQVILNFASNISFD